jgi:hypothetical protein
MHKPHAPVCVYIREPAPGERENKGFVSFRIRKAASGCVDNLSKHIQTARRRRRLERLNIHQAVVADASSIIIYAIYTSWARFLLLFGRCREEKQEQRG